MNRRLIRIMYTIIQCCILFRPLHLTKQLRSKQNLTNWLNASNGCKNSLKSISRSHFLKKKNRPTNIAKNKKNLLYMMADSFIWRLGD
jgi:hypothetical protein